MAQSTKIEWTDKSWNPVVGCTRVSAGCDNCYAVRMSHRLEALGGAQYAGLTVLNGKRDRHFNGTVRCVPDVLDAPLHWRKPCKIFVNSMSDLFHKDVPSDFIAKVFAVMALCPQHTFQVLTKRPERMAEYLGLKGVGFRISQAVKRLHLPTCYAALARDRTGGPLGVGGTKGWPLPNVWLGTSCEDQPTADERITHLLKCPAAVRFLSMEPLLGGVGLRNLPCGEIEHAGMAPRPVVYDALQDFDGHPGIRQVIVGGESGPGARPMDPRWVRDIRDQCEAAGVPFFFKQWGEWIPILETTGSLCSSGEGRGKSHIFRDETGSVVMARIGKKKAGRILDGRTHDAMPEVTA